jgi:hypothetical protein
LLDDGQLDGFDGFNGLHGDPTGVLDGIKFFSIACPLWHNSKRGTNRRERQAVRISNGPTTEKSERKRISGIAAKPEACIVRRLGSEDPAPGSARASLMPWH